MRLRCVSETGDAALHLPGSDGRYTQQDALLYQQGCLRFSGCEHNRQEYDSMVLRGLHSLLTNFVHTAHTVLERVTFAGNNTTVLSLDALSALPDLRFVMYAAENDLRDGATRSRRLYEAEQQTITEQLGLFFMGVVVFNLLFIVALYGTRLNPAVAPPRPRLRLTPA